MQGILLLLLLSVKILYLTIHRKTEKNMGNIVSK